MLRTILIDDEKSAREALGLLLKIYAPNIDIIAQADGVTSGIEVINEYEPDLVFLDIHLGDGSGFDLLDHFTSRNFLVVFVTAFEDYAIKAFKFSAMDYLVKPVIPDDLVKTIEKLDKHSSNSTSNSQIEILKNAYTNPESPDNKIVLKTAEAIHLINITDIVRCQSDNNYTLFHLTNHKKVLVSRTLKEYDELLADAGFIRVHQSHLINIRQIDHFDKREGGTLEMKDGSIIPVSFRKKEQIIQLIQQMGRHL